MGAVRQGRRGVSRQGSTRGLRSALVAGALPLLGFGVARANPPPQRGLEVGVSGGGGRSAYGGCGYSGATSYIAGDAWASNSWESGLYLQGAGSIYHPTEVETSYSEGEQPAQEELDAAEAERLTRGSVAFGIGGNWRHGGFAIGPGVLFSDGVKPIPSARAWVNGGGFYAETAAASSSLLGPSSEIRLECGVETDHLSAGAMIAANLLEPKREDILNPNLMVGLSFAFRVPRLDETRVAVTARGGANRSFVGGGASWRRPSGEVPEPSPRLPDTTRGDPGATAVFEAVQGVTPTEGSGLLAPAMPPDRVTLDE